jgi:hypothetical protein
MKSRPSLLPGALTALLLLAGLATGSARAGETWRHPSRGWQVEIPAGWKEFSPAARLGLQPSLGSVRFDAGFAPSDSEQATAYVLVHFVPMSLEKAGTSDLEKACRSRAVLGQPGIESARFDAGSGRMILKFRRAVPGAGPVRGLAYGFPGRDGIAQLIFYDRAGTFDRYLGDFEQMAISFRWDPGLEWEPSSPLNRILIFGVVGLLGAIVVGVAARKSRSRGRAYGRGTDRPATRGARRVDRTRPRRAPSDYRRRRDR